MSLRQLVEGDCGGVNPLMQLGGQFTRDTARKDEGLSSAQFERSLRPDDHMVHQFLGQVAGPPHSFQMETLLQEMREIAQATNAEAQQLHAAPRVLEEVSGQWSKEFAMHQQPQLQSMAPPLPMHMVHMQPQQQQTMNVHEFFDHPSSSAGFMRLPEQYYTRQPLPNLAICPAAYTSTTTADQFFSENEAIEKQSTKALQGESTDDWVNDFQSTKDENEQTTASYNEKFWARLEDEWQKLSEDSSHTWLSECSENYDPYKEYQFAEENPMSELVNAYEKGKEFLEKGDIPSAAMCFEVAAKKEPENAEVWELLGLTQSENEMDPQSISALKRSLDLKADNPRVLMALAVCYTNEGLQSRAVTTLINWLQVNPKYKHLIEQHPELQPVQGGAGAMTSSMIPHDKLKAVQQLYLDAVHLSPLEVDSDVQEALGVLFNLSSEFNKAADCFQASLSVDPGNAKVWNRLGASLANGSRSVEAVDAYKQALELEPGFVRARYNVGVCCMNLKAYRQAVEHLLTALNMQANTAALRELPEGAATLPAGQRQMSESIWTTLKMVISLMGRSDLHGMVTERNLVALNECFKE